MHEKRKKCQVTPWINKVTFYHSKRLFTQGPIILINLIQVWFEPVLTGSNKLSCCPNLRLVHWSSPALRLNLGPGLGLVLQSLGLNFGSRPNCGITIHNTNMYKHKLYACPILYLLHLWQCHLFDYPGPQFMWELYISPTSRPSTLLVVPPKTVVSINWKLSQMTTNQSAL